MFDFQTCKEFLLSLETLDWNSTDAKDLVDIFKRMSESAFLQNLTIDELEELVSLHSHVVSSFQFKTQGFESLDFRNLNSGPKIS